jgi:hypothetical protein
MKMHVKIKANCVAQQQQATMRSSTKHGEGEGMAWLTFFTHRSNLNRDKSNDKKTYG